MPYDAPAPATLKLRYPALATVDDALLQYWLTDAERSVDHSWSEADYAPALMALAAHNLAMQGQGASTSAAVAGLRDMGVTDFRSGSLSASFSSEAVAAAVKGGYGATRYGLEYQALLRRNKAGPRVISSGSAAVGCGYRDRPIP